MMKISKTIIFFGTDNFSLVALKGLFESGYNIVAVVTKPDSKSGRGQSLVSSCVKKFALENNIPVWQPSKISEINEDIKKIGGNIAGILVSFGKIIPQSTIELFKPGIINVHPSLLPLYRGPSPIESAIKNGDRETGVSIMKLTSKMDAGPIYEQFVYKMSDHETRPELYKKLAQLGTIELLNLLPNILDQLNQPKSQNENQSSYCQLLNKNEAWINPNKITAPEAERLVRAYLDFPKTKINILDRTIIIIKSHITNEYKTPLDVLCQDGKYLSIDELIAPSGRTMSAQDFINGHLQTN